MTTEGESRAAAGHRTEREQLDLIAAYVRDQRKTEQSWSGQLGRFTVYLALAAFFFGIGTLSDLQNRIVSPPPPPSEVARKALVGSLDEGCEGKTTVRLSKKKSTGYERIAADDLEILEARVNLNHVWFSQPASGAMTRKDRAAFTSITSNYFAANDFLQAAVDRAKAGDEDGYARDIGLYRRANASFVKEAADFGFETCDVSWGVDGAPPPFAVPPGTPL